MIYKWKYFKTDSIFSLIQKARLLNEGSIKLMFGYTDKIVYLNLNDILINYHEIPDGFDVSVLAKDMGPLNKKEKVDPYTMIKDSFGLILDKDRPDLKILIDKFQENYEILVSKLDEIKDSGFGEFGFFEKKFRNFKLL